MFCRLVSAVLESQEQRLGHSSRSAARPLSAIFPAIEPVWGRVRNATDPAERLHLPYPLKANALIAACLLAVKGAVRLVSQLPDSVARGY
jgi:hypothetical protein